MNPEDCCEGWAEKIEAAQQHTSEEIGGQVYERVKYGADFPNAAERCGDCGVEHGQYHVLTCCTERCPRCRGQALGCPCADNPIAAVH